MRQPGPHSGTPDGHPTPRLSRQLFFGSLATALLLLSSPSSAAPPMTSPCGDCHGDQVAAASKGPHAGVASRDPRYCESCHGYGKKHVESMAAADIVGKALLEKVTPSERSLSCLSCHRGGMPGWEGSAHARLKEIACGSCHGDAGHDLKGKPVARRGEAVCASCHVEQVSQFRRVYHHPVPEGRMSCASCHDVHGKEPAGVRRVDATCVSCHAEVSGPYVFPHRALEDGCSSCHSPHGSVNRGLLKTAGNGACLTCHVQSNFPAVGKVPHNRNLQGGGKCLDCHSEAHGSNVDPLMAPQYRKR